MEATTTSASGRTLKLTWHDLSLGNCGITGIQNVSFIVNKSDEELRAAALQGGFVGNTIQDPAILWEEFSVNAAWVVAHILPAPLTEYDYVSSKCMYLLTDGLISHAYECAVPEVTGTRIGFGHLTTKHLMRLLASRPDLGTTTLSHLVENNVHPETAVATCTFTPAKCSDKIMHEAVYTYHAPDIVYPDNKLMRICKTMYAALLSKLSVTEVEAVAKE